ncbi:OmpA family protein [Spirosoma luteolum]
MKKSRLTFQWIVLIGLVLLSSLKASAQADSLLRQADRLLAWKAYGRAIDAYTQLLAPATGTLTPEQRSRAQAQLALAYQQVGDGTKAERVYRELIGGNTPVDPRYLLRYAQTLAGNGKFQEGQQQYERYLQVQAKTPSRAGISATVPAATGRQNPAQYRLEYLDLDTDGEEFSPAFYQNGLVYVSGTKGGATIEGKGGGAGYLDLLYAPDRNNLKASRVIGDDGTITTVPVERKRSEQQQLLGSDAYTRPTANDSRTVPGFEVGINIAQGLGYEATPVNQSRQFSKTLNTRYHEGPATFSPDGSQIIFTRNNLISGRKGTGADSVSRLKLYTARQRNGAWINVEELPFNSDDFSVGHPTLTRDGQLLYFVSDKPGGYGGTDLYVSRLVNGRWGEAVNLGEAVNSRGNELFPFVDEEGNLYFSSDGLKGLGALDIFFARLIGGTSVGTVEHLDAPINSPQDDFGLITDANRTGGYFSSNRRNGNDDILRFVRQGSLYDCRNLTVRLYDVDTDAPLDSVQVVVKMRGEGRANKVLVSDSTGLVRLCLESDNDFMLESSRDGYVMSTIGFSTRYLTDDQPSQLEIGLSKPEILIDTVAQVIETPVVINKTTAPTRSRIRGVVLSERDQKPIGGVRVQLRNECDRTLRETVTTADGRYTFDLAPGCDYTLIASKKEFGTNTNRIRRLPKRAKPKELSADLKMLSVGDVVTIDNIYYDLDQFTLRPDAARELERLVATMRKYPSLVIEIRSHTDSRGDAAHNKMLSTQRANSVASYLISKGISRRRIMARGMGESMLVNNCTDGVICTEAEHQRNRRTEFRVVDIR